MRNIKIVSVPAILGSSLLMLACLGIIAGWGAYWKDSAIALRGEKADARVIEKNFRYSADGDSSYMVSYQFRLPGGSDIQGQRPVDKEMFERLQKDDSIVVLYSEEDPKRNFPEGGGITSVWPIIFATVICLIVGGLGAILVLQSIGPEAENRQSDNLGA